MCLVSTERIEKMLYDNEAYSLLSIMRGNEDISLIKRVSFLLGRTVQQAIRKHCYDYVFSLSEINHKLQSSQL